MRLDWSWMLAQLTHAIRFALTHDPDTCAQLNGLSKKHIHIEIVNLNKCFAIHFYNNDIVLDEDTHHLPDAIIRGSAHHFLRQDFQKLIIEGDALLCQRVQQLMKHFKFDWEGALANVTNDIFAHNIAQCVQANAEKIKHLQQNCRLNIRDYLQEEINCIPSIRMLEDFYDDLSELTLQVERLHARIHMLQEKLTQ